MNPIRKETAANGLKGRRHRLDEVVKYQDGAIVSREVIGRKSGTITAFAFDAGQQLSEHTAPFDAVVVGIDGEAEITVGGHPHRIHKGEMIIMPAGIPHSLAAVSRFKMLLVMIKM